MIHTPEFDAVKNAMSLADAKSTAQSWKNKYEGAVKFADEVEKQLNLVLGLDKPKQQKVINKLTSSKPDGVAVICPLSDFHVEETVLYNAVNGKNEFNLTIAEKRIKRLFNKITELIEWQNHLAPVIELWLPMLGDLISGGIHDDLVETNSLSPTEACVFLRDQLCNGINFLLKETKLPIIIPTVNGNHGRTTQKIRIKTGARNSFEWLLYSTLAKIYEGNKRVTFMVGTGQYNIQKVMGRTIRFSHGDNFRYNGGIGGITIPVNKSIAQLDKLHVADLDIFAHYHQFTWGYNKWISCGTLMGYNDFALSIKCDFQHPSQTFIVLDRRYGVTNCFPIFLTRPWRSKK